tara:strand:- start:36021 stop:36572 length:552 start_codon:yes stop_codon:yes gene_type:complete
MFFSPYGGGFSPYGNMGFSPYGGGIATLNPRAKLPPSQQPAGTETSSRSELKTNQEMFLDNMHPDDRARFNQLSKEEQQKYFAGASAGPSLMGGFGSPMMGGLGSFFPSPMMGGFGSPMMGRFGSPMMGGFGSPMMGGLGSYMTMGPPPMSSQKSLTPRQLELLEELRESFTQEDPYQMYEFQ